MLLPSNKSLQILPRSLHITVSNAFESSWHCLSGSPTCSSSNLLGHHRLHSFQNLTQKVDVQQEEKICKAQNFYFMLLSTNLSSQPPPNNQLWPSDWLKIYWKPCFCEDIKRKIEKETSASGCCLAQILLVPCPNGWHTAILIFWRSAFRTRFSSPWICHAWFTIDHSIIKVIFMLIGRFLSHSGAIMHWWGKLISR